MKKLEMILTGILASIFLCTVICSIFYGVYPKGTRDSHENGFVVGKNSDHEISPSSGWVYWVYNVGAFPMGWVKNNDQERAIYEKI